MTRQLTLAGAVIDAHTPVRRTAQPLRNMLRLNAATSLLGGLVAAALGGPLNAILDTSSTNWIRTIGFGLVIFAVDVVIVAGTSIQKLKRYTPLVSAADAVWVAASIATITLGWFSTTGAIVIGVVAAMVATFGIRQIILVRRLAHAPQNADAVVMNESPPTEVFHFQAPIACSPALAWSIVTDHELYGRLAPNLGAVAATAPNGPGLTRSCSNRGGEAWNETCTLWHDGEQYDIDVDTTNYPYPLTEMRGSWWVRCASETTVGMDFRYRPTATLRGRLLAIAMQTAFPFVLRRITRGWQTEAIKRSRPA